MPWKGIKNVNHVLSRLKTPTEGTREHRALDDKFLNVDRVSRKNKRNLVTYPEREGVGTSEDGSENKDLYGQTCPLGTHSRCYPWKSHFSVSSSKRQDEMRSERSFQSFRLLLSNSSKEKFKGKNP